MREYSRTLEFLVWGKPVPQPRVRFSRFSNRAFVPAKHPIHEYKNLIAEAFVSEFHTELKEPLEGPLELDVLFVFPRQPTKVWKKKPMPRYYHTTKNADIDNCWKAVADALNGIAYVDDCQIVTAKCEKWRCAGKEDPHTRIIVREIKEE